MKFDPEFNDTTYHILMKIYSFLCDGRVYLARDEMEKLLNIPPEGN
jgi:hypothetical protein